MKKIQDFIKTQFTSFPEYELTADDNKIIKKTNLAEWLTYKLVSGKFRKAPIHPETRKDIFNKIKNSLKANKPIYFLICFGGYKHYWNTSHPQIDWAELFNIKFMADYASPILSVHKPGVILEYEAEDFILPLMNNYPEDRPDAYEQSFKTLLNNIQSHFPKNLKVNYIRAKSQYDTSILFKRLDKVVQEKLKELDKLSKDEKNKILHKTEENIMWKGKKDLTTLNDNERQDFIKKSRCINGAFLQMDYEIRKDYFIGNDHIGLVLSWGTTKDNIDHWLSLGSTYSSTVDFWIGRGIFEDRGTKIVPRIVSHTQYDRIKDKLIKVKTDLIPLNNFKSIEVYPGELRFNT